jgi:hypothetical protein
MVQEREENYERRPAFSAEPTYRHMRLTDEQLTRISEEFHNWRELRGEGERIIQASFKSKPFGLFESIKIVSHILQYIKLMFLTIENASVVQP